MQLFKKWRVTPFLFVLVAVPLFAQNAYVRTTIRLGGGTSAPYCTPWVDSGVKAGATWTTTSNYFEVFTGTQYQTIQGFGGCFCEIGWDAIQSLTSAAARDEVIKALFDTSGCNYTFCRLAVGANDFAVGYYSYDDVSGDYSMNNFSISRDQQKIIPFVKAAQAYKPNMRFWASPWTPPAWMKSNGVYNGGNMNSASSQTLTAYALYLSKYVQAMRGQGINVEYITCQNEPDQCTQNYPTCCWTNTQQINFYQNYMIPRFNTDGLTTRILIGVYCCGNYSDWVTPYWNNSTVAGKIGVVSHSWQTTSWGAQNWNEHPSIPFFETEADWGQNAVHDWGEGVNQFTSRINFLTTGRSAVFSAWNMVLDERYQSNWGFRQSAPININRSTHVVSYEPHYWADKHISHYVMPGAKAVNMTTIGTNPGPKAAFLNPNGDIIVIVGNTSGSALAATIKVGTRMYKPNLPAYSFNTIRISSTTAALPGITGEDIGIPAVSEARICNSTLYFTLSAAEGAREMDLSLADLQGRIVWTGYRAGSALQGGQQIFTVRSKRGHLHSGTYLLSVKTVNGSGTVTTVEKKVSAVN